MFIQCSKRGFSHSYLVVTLRDLILCLWFNCNNQHRLHITKAPVSRGDKANKSHCRSA